MKKVSILALVLAIALFFTGCTNGELKLYNAFLKSQDIMSMESNTNLSFKLEGEGLSEDNQVMLEEAIKVVNSSKVTMNQKVKQNKDKTEVKAQVDMGIDMAGVKTDMQVWVDVDMSKDVPKIVEVIKMPQMLMSTLGKENESKEYILYDINEVLDMQEGEINYKELMNWSKEMQPKITDFLENYAKSFDSGIKMMEYKGNRALNNEVVDVYELKLDDESFKNLMRYSVNNFMENKDMMKFMNEYMDMVVGMMDSTKGENVEAKKEMMKEFENIEKELPVMKEKFNKFMDDFDKVKVLGNEGIVIEYAINKDGYIVSEKGSINLSIDLATMESKVNELNKAGVKAPVMKGIVKLKIEFDTKNSNINKDVKIEMPKLTDANSLKISDIIKSSL